MTKITYGWICSSPIYEYKGVRFEFSQMGGPLKLNKDWQPSKQQGGKFLDVFTEWRKLPEKKQEKYRIGGGCQRF